MIPGPAARRRGGADSRRSVSRRSASLFQGTTHGLRVVFDHVGHRADGASLAVAPRELTGEIVGQRLQALQAGQQGGD
jgi:hypothetical protein